LPNNDASLIPVASFLLVKASNPEALLDGKGKPIIRPYTPVSPPDTPGELALLIKRYEQGNMSKHIFSLKAGDTLSMKGPLLKFPYQANQFDEVVLIGGGAGITPLYQVLNHALSDKNNNTKFKLLYSNITEKDILLREELEALQKSIQNIFKLFSLSTTLVKAGKALLVISLLTLLRDILVLQVFKTRSKFLFAVHRVKSLQSLERKMG